MELGDQDMDAWLGANLKFESHSILPVLPGSDINLHLLHRNGLLDDAEELDLLELLDGDDSMLSGPLHESIQDTRQQAHTPQGMAQLSNDQLYQQQVELHSAAAQQQAAAGTGSNSPWSPMQAATAPQQHPSPQSGTEQATTFPSMPQAWPGAVGVGLPAQLHCPQAHTANAASFAHANALAAAAQAQINAAAGQDAAAARVSLTSAVNAASAQLLAAANAAQQQQALAAQQQQQAAPAPAAVAAAAATRPNVQLQMARVASGTASGTSGVSLSAGQHLAAATPTPTSQPFCSLPGSAVPSQTTAAGVPSAPFAAAAAAAAVPTAVVSAAAVPAMAAGQFMAMSSAPAAAGLAGFQGVMLTPAGASTGVAIGSNLMLWVQGLQRVATQQHEAHERKYKQRRKDKVATLQAELSSKRAQLQALSLEHMALTAKARALDQLVASAGDDVSLMEEQLAKLDLRSGSKAESEEAAAAAAAAVAAIQGEVCWPRPSSQQRQQQQQVQQAQQRGRPVAAQQQLQQQQQVQQQLQPQQQQQQQQAPQPQQLSSSKAGYHYQQLHQQGLQHLMATHLESLEDILSGVGAATSAAPAAGQAGAPDAAAAGAGGTPGLPNMFGSPAAAAPPLDDKHKQQQQQQQQQQQLSSSSGNPCTTTTASAKSGSSASGLSGDAAAAQTSSCTSSPAVEGNVYGTAAAAVAAAEAAAAGAPSGLLVAGNDEYNELSYTYGHMLPRGLQLEEKLPEIQALHKRVVVQLMPLLLQVQQEQLQAQVEQGASAAASQQQQAAVAMAAQQQAMAMQQLWGYQQPEPLPQLPAGLIQETQAMRKLTELMLEYSRELHTFAITNRVSTQQLYTLNIETGVLGVPPPPHHWKKVGLLLKDRLSPQALADLCVARQLYSSTVMRIKQQRQLLVLQLQQLLDRYTSMDNYRTDTVFNSVTGPHCEGTALLDAIDSNMRKEYTLEGVYQWMTHHIIPMHVLAEMVVHSYPYKADIHMTLQELMREQPMPALTALQQLQLQQLQEQQANLISQQQTASALLAHQQQAAAMITQQQQAAHALQMLQQQQQMLGAAAAGIAAGYGLGHGGYK